MKTVVCAIIWEDKKVLVAQRSSSMDQALKWEFPGGKVKHGESFENCVIREINEELSILVSVEAYLDCFEYFSENLNIQLHAFMCKIKEGHIVVNEHARIKWLEISELDRLDWCAPDIPLVKFLMSLV